MAARAAHQAAPVRKAHLDQTHGFFNGTAIFLSAEGLAEAPHAVTLHPPADPKCADWKVATTLPRTSGGPHEFGTCLAADYDALIDRPVEMGTFELVDFEVEGVPHEIAVSFQVPPFVQLASASGRI